MRQWYFGNVNDNQREDEIDKTIWIKLKNEWPLFQKYLPDKIYYYIYLGKNTFFFV